MSEKVSPTTTTEPPADPVATNEVLTADTYQQMLDVLKDLTNHTHVFYDDYGTACNCNCNCTCCFAGEVMVLVKLSEDGEEQAMPARDIPEMVWVKNGNNRWVKVKWEKYGQDTIWDIVLENGMTISATSNHRFPYWEKDQTPTPLLTEDKNAKVATTNALQGKYLRTDDGTLVKVLSSNPTTRVEDVFCCVEEETHAFYLYDVVDSRYVMVMNCVRGMVW